MIAALLATTAGRALAGTAVAVAIVAAAYAFGHHTGYSSAGEDMRVAAIKDAVKRVGDMEKNNAAFKNLPALERCRAIMRDSRLPAGNCD